MVHERTHPAIPPVRIVVGDRPSLSGSIQGIPCPDRPPLANGAALRRSKSTTSSSRSAGRSLEMVESKSRDLPRWSRTGDAATGTKAGSVGGHRQRRSAHSDVRLFTYGGAAPDTIRRPELDPFCRTAEEGLSFRDPKSRGSNDGTLVARKSNRGCQVSLDAGDTQP